MSITLGSKISHKDLLFHFDMNNVKKSWKGKPTVNQIYDKGYTTNSTTVAVSALPKLHELKKLVSEIKLPVRQNVDANWKDLYQCNSFTLAAGATVVYSIWVYTSKTDSRFNCNGNFGTTLGTNIGLGSIYDTPPNIWTKLSYHKKNTTGSSITVSSLRFETGSTSVWADGIDAYAVNPQIEIRTDSVNSDTPFIAGSRTGSQAIADMANKNTFSISDLTYDSDGGFEFDGTNDYFTATNVDNYPATWSDHFTIEAVIRIPSGAVWQHVDGNTTANSGTGIIARGSYQGSIGLLRYGNAGSESLRFFMRSDAKHNNATLSNAQFDTWYHLAGTFDGTNLKLYVNGQLHATTVMNKGTDVPDTGNWKIGGYTAFGGNNGLYGEGQIPLGRVYSKALTANEVLNNFAATRARFNL